MRKPIDDEKIISLSSERYQIGPAKLWNKHDFSLGGKYVKQRIGPGNARIGLRICRIMGQVWRNLIDTVLMLILIGPILMLIYGAQYWSSAGLVKGFWDFVFNWIFPAIAIGFFWVYKQATPGKMLIRARIVDERTGGVPDIRQWVIRYLGYFVSGIALALGFLWVGWDKKKQGWHDKLASTVVIRPQDKGVQPVEFSE